MIVNIKTDIPIEARNKLEELIFSNKQIQKGLSWGWPRKGHPEGATIFHVKEIFEEIDKLCELPETKTKLRILAIIHDSFKYKVNRAKPRVGENNHGMIARRFTENFINSLENKNDKRILTSLLDIIELHDEFYFIYLKVKREGVFREVRFHKMLSRLIEENLFLYLKFMDLDGSGKGKNPISREWFKLKLKKCGYWQKIDI